MAKVPDAFDMRTLKRDRESVPPGWGKTARPLQTKPRRHNRRSGERSPTIHRHEEEQARPTQESHTSVVVIATTSLSTMYFGRDQIGLAVV
ncbi:unnamed protein product [Cochlearia groenlandica]